jgi:predicted nucleotidyltransferase
MKYGLKDEIIEKMQSVFASFPGIERVTLYGSRAKGNFRPGSDIDLALHGESLTPGQLRNIAEALDDLLLPYMIDLSIFEQLDHAELRSHIERVGQPFYTK